MKIAFTKMAGTGNDFILIDNRTGTLKGECRRLIRHLCTRRISVGADGLLLLEESPRADFRMRYFNADGGEAEFCGNGARCIARYAYLNDIAGEKMSFDSQTGIRTASVNGAEVTIDMPDPENFRLNVSLPELSLEVHTVTVGVPHAVCFVDDVRTVDVVDLGRRIRHLEMFSPAGTNVNFVQILDGGELVVRTYERGVEDETYSCGTGISASALISARVHSSQAPVAVQTSRGDRLTVSFQMKTDTSPACMLTGEARVIYQGTLSIDQDRRT